MSDYMDNQYEYEAKVERLIIIIYSIYSVLLAYVASREDWGMMVFMVFFADLAVSWSLFLTKSKTFRLRATVTSVLMLFSLYIYSLMSSELVQVLPVMVALIIVIGLYEIPELIVLCVATTALLYIHHGLILGDIPFTDVWTENLRLGLRLLAVFLAEYAAYYLVYNQKEARRRQTLFIEELKEAEQSRDDFLANVSHELRTPINTINGMSEMVLREQLSDEVRQEIYNIQSSGRNLLSVVSDILDYSELQAGEIEIVEESYNITSTINDIINMTLAKKEDKNIELVVDCDATLPSALMGDEQKLRRVIMNLVNNAIKYTQNGCIRIDIGYRKESYGINLTVGVKDTGIGMTKADIEKLFAGFGQIDTKRNRKDKGIGLGLAISSAIIDGMGGFFSVESEYGTGTDISFSVPQKVVDDTPIASVDDAPRIKVLVYFNMEQYEYQEIRESYSRTMKHMISQLGVEVMVCRNLAELKRREERAVYSHVFISLAEYKEDMEFFHMLARRTKLIVVIDRWQEQEIRDANILRLYKPFFVLPVTMFLNDRAMESNAMRKNLHYERFIAPEAHILIVDDNLLNIKVAEGLLKPYMIRTTRALSGKEALEKIKTQEYDFVFMDHMMPEMDGIECLEHIREIPGSYFKEVPVIALTANAIGGTREMFLEKGFADFVAKPIELSVLERVLRRNLPNDKVMRISEEEAAELGQIREGRQNPPSESAAPAPSAAPWPEPPRGASPSETMQGTRKAAPSAGVTQSAMGASPRPEGRPYGASPSEMTQGIRGGAAPAAASGSGNQPQNQRQKSGALVVGDLDVEQGKTYCGGEENYLEVLELQTQDHATLPRILETYEKEDWKNYIILVHGVKSTMKSIGAQPLSDQAKALEFAGKAENYEYIHASQEAFLKEYRRVQGEIADFFRGDSGESAKEEPEESVPVISSEEFAGILSEFETAMYSMEEGPMKELLQKLETYRYGDMKLKDELKSVAKKVEMSDYFAAFDALQAVYDRGR